MLTITRHIVLWIVALSVLNTSIDITETFLPAHHDANSIASSDNYNEIESIVEYLIDESTDHEQQMPDNKNNDQETLLKKMAAFDFSMPVKKQKLLSPVVAAGLTIYPALPHTTFLPSGHSNRLIQPPDQA